MPSHSFQKPNIGSLFSQCRHDLLRIVAGVVIDKDDFPDLTVEAAFQFFHERPDVRRLVEDGDDNA